MSLLILGLVIFLGVHTLTTLRPTRAAVIGRLGDGGYKGLYSLLAAVGLVLIVWGFGHYRATDDIQLWSPPVALKHIARLLMWLAFVALAATYAPLGKIKSTLRHPMLVSVKTWALAHLLANGDLGALILFGAFLAWAVYDRIAVKRRGDTGAPPVAGFTSGDMIAIAAGTAAYVAMFWLHPMLIGVPII
ncbi:MAG: NnrU family protein [Proteobacteria bacterium]|nr:NnrU family protein [Pseudomonadota bacterium]